MTEREIPSNEELFDGVMNDGSAPPLHSGKLYEHWQKPLPTDEQAKSSHQQTADELHYKIDLALLSDYDSIRRLGLNLTNAAVEVTERQRSKSQQTEEKATPNEEAATREDVGSDSGDADLTRQPSVKKPARGVPDIPEPPDVRGPYQPREPRPQRKLGPAVVPDPPSEAKQNSINDVIKAAADVAETIDRMAVENQAGQSSPIKPRTKSELCSVLNPGQILTMGERGARLLAMITEKRAALAHSLVERTLAVDAKTDFIWDRAHAVVAVTLLHLDETFADIGFGSWMPFRYPDQWLMFCGVLNRVLAANGLIGSKHAETYRKLLEETPPVDFPEGIEDVRERIDKLKTPENWSRCWINRGASTMTELKERLENEVWNKAPPN